MMTVDTFLLGNKESKVIIVNFGSFSCSKNQKIRSLNPDFDIETGLNEISRIS